MLPILNPPPARNGRRSRCGAIALASLLALLLCLPAGAWAGPPTQFSSGITPDSYPDAITAGPDGNLWFTEYGSGRIGRITPSGVVTEFPVGPVSNSIAVGPDGNLWFPDISGKRIVRITPAGAATAFPTQANESWGGPYVITAGPDGNMWFTEIKGVNTMGNVNRIGKFSLADSSFAMYGNSFTPGIKNTPPRDIVKGPDGNLWFTLPGYETIVFPGGDRIGRITPEGVVTTFPVTPGSEPNEITAGPDGNLWFTESRARQIGRITPDGVVTEFAAGISTGNESLGGITAGPDGNLWFTERVSGLGFGRIGRITPAGAVTEYLASCTEKGYFGDLAWGADGSLWLTQPEADAILKVSDPAAPCTRAAPLGLKFGKLKKNARKGTAVLIVVTPTGGELTLTGTGLVKVKRTLPGAATVRLGIKTKSVTRRKLRKNGKVQRTVEVSLKTATGDLLSKRRGVKLTLPPKKTR